MKWLVLFAIQLLSEAACVSVSGDKILAADLAHVDPAFAGVPADAVVSYSPLPGAKRIFSARELSNYAKRFGLTDLSVASTACFYQALQPLDEPLIRAAIAESLHWSPGDIEIADFSRYPVPAGHIEFPTAGLSGSIWKGRVVTNSGKTIPIWARVRAVREFAVLAAKVDLKAGETILTDQFTTTMVRQVDASTAYLNDSAKVAGKIPLRTIPSGTLLRANMLGEPREVNRGDTISVTAGNGAAQISFTAIAQTGGRKGEAIIVRNPENGRSFRAKIVSKGKAEVHT